MYVFSVFVGDCKLIFVNCAYTFINILNTHVKVVSICNLYISTYIYNYTFAGVMSSNCQEIDGYATGCIIILLKVCLHTLMNGLFYKEQKLPYLLFPSNHCLDT